MRHPLPVAKTRAALALTLLLQAAGSALAQDAGDVSSLVREALREADRASLARVSVTTEFADQGSAVTADPRAVRRAFRNVIQYSALSMEGRPASLQIRTVRRGTRVYVEFRDTGPGLGLAEIAAIYTLSPEAFDRGSGPAGLAETRRIAADAGGLLQVSSEDGVGTAFLVDLPVRKDDPQTIAAR